MSSSGPDYFTDTLQVLVGSCGDKDDIVNSAVIKSLSTISAVHPNIFIECFCNLYKNTAKMNPVQLGNIIKVLEQTCVNHMKVVELELAKELVSAMLRSMTQNADYQPTIQMGASAVLVAIGHVHLDLVLQSLIKEVSPSSVPHYTIPHTLGTLAAVNTQDVVPFVKDILAKMLPLLPLVRVEGTKQAFAFSFGHFAVAVSEQIGDNVENDNITSIKENFVVEFSIIFDVLYNQWLHSSEPKVSESVLEALGPITRLISERKFDETVNKLILSLLSLYRKTLINPFYVSQCLSYLLTPSALNPKLILNDSVVTALNHTLFNLIILEPDYDQPQTVKNHFEVLRCFDHVAGQFLEPTIEGLLNQCKHNQIRDRMKAVIILTHLVTSSQIFIEKYATKFIAILKVMTAMEQELKMKKLLVKAIVGLVYRNCLVSAEDFSMVEFIIKHCDFEPPVVPKADHVTAKSDTNDLHDTCKSSLILLCNSATKVRSRLRDLLLKALTVDDFTPSMATVSQCLSSLLQNNATGDDKQDNVSEYKVSPDLVFIRCLTHLSEPEKVDRNKNLLTFLDEYSADVHKNLNSNWSVEVGRMRKFAAKQETNEEWHRMLLSFLVSAIENINSHKWVENVSALLSHEILTIKQPPMIKGVSLQMLAVLSCHMSNAAVVEQVLKIILLALKSIPMESVDYVSTAVGIASRKHGEYVLNDLDAVFKDIEAKRGSRILSFISSRHSKNEAEINVSKYAIITCYGKVAANCMDVHVLGRLGENVTSMLLEVLKQNPPMDMCRASVTTLYEIGKALQPAPHHNVVIRNRWQLLNSVLEQIYNPNLEKENVRLYPIIVKASKALTKLQKGILPEERNTILRALFSNIFGELSIFKLKYVNDGNGDESDLLAKTLNDSLNLLHDLIKELIIQSTCISTLDDIIGQLFDWLRHENEEIRTATIQIFHTVLDTYLKNVKLNYETPGKFSQMGYLLGLIISGIADTSFPVRINTIDCIKLIIQIQYLYEGDTLEADDECMERLTAIHKDILTNDVDKIVEYSTSISEAICDKIPHHLIMQFIESILESYDDEELRSSGISAVLDGLFAIKGQDLFQTIERIVEVILGTMDRVDERAGNKLMKPFTSLTRHHSNAVTAVLLAQKIPLKPSVIACWRYLAKDESLSVAILNNFTRLMSSIELFEDPYHITENHIAALQPLTLISALGEMLQEPAMSSLCHDKFPDLFSVLYTTVACYMDAMPPAYSVPSNKGQERFGFIPNREAIKLSPVNIALGTFTAFLERAGCEKVVEACSNLTIEHSGSLPLLASSISSALVTSPSGAVTSSALVTSLASYVRCPLPPQRCAAIALLAEMLQYRCNDSTILIETIIAVLTSGCKDSHDRVRACSLRGVANVVALRREHRDAAVPAALAALSRGLDASRAQSPIDNVPLAAIEGLSKLLTTPSLPADSERELLVISQKIRPYFNTDCPKLREHSIRLFGIIAGKVKSDSLVDQSLASLPCFLLHLCDNNAAVVKASKHTLKNIFKNLNTPKANDLVQMHLVDEGRLFLDEFLSALLKQVSKERPEMIVECLRSAGNYLSSSQAELATAAAALVGKLYSELYKLRTDRAHQPTEGSTEVGSTVEVGTIDAEVTRDTHARLLQLLKSGDSALRANAARALAYVSLCSAGR